MCVRALDGEANFLLTVFKSILMDHCRIAGWMDGWMDGYNRIYRMDYSLTGTMWLMLGFLHDWFLRRAAF